MEHREYVRLAPDAKTAVLFLHGIVGTPNHFRDLLPLVQTVPEEWSVYNLLLPGHGGSVEEFGRSSMNQWKEKVRTVFGELAASHDRVMIVGHSMGTLFAMQLAREYPEKVPLLFLIAAPMRPCLGLSAATNSLRLVFGRIRPDRPVETAIQMACGAEPTFMIWKYLFWLPRFAELFAEVHKTEKLMSGLSVPCSVWQSGHDELVTAASRRVLEKIRGVEVHILPNSRHFYYDPKDREFLVQTFREKCFSIAE